MASSQTNFKCAGSSRTNNGRIKWCDDGVTVMRHRCDIGATTAWPGTTLAWRCGDNGAIMMWYRCNNDVTIHSQWRDNTTWLLVAVGVTVVASRCLVISSWPVSSTFFLFAIMNWLPYSYASGCACANSANVVEKTNTHAPYAPATTREEGKAVRLFSLLAVIHFFHVQLTFASAKITRCGCQLLLYSFYGLLKRVKGRHFFENLQLLWLVCPAESL